MSAPENESQSAIDERLLLRALVDTVPDPIFCKDRQGRYIFSNLANREMFGDGFDTIGKTVFEVPGLKEHAELYHADDMHVMTTGVPVVNREEPFKRPDGTGGWFLTSKHPLRNERGEVIGLVGIARDITRRRLDEEFRAEQALLVRTLLEAVADPIFFKDADGRFIVQNRAYRELFQINNLDCGNRADTDFAGVREYADLYRADDLKVIRTGEPIINREEPYATPDGRRGWFLTSKFPHRDFEGKVVGIIGIARDITELKRSAEELEQTRQRLIDHVENSPFAVIEWDPEMRINRWSGRAEQMFGWTAEEVANLRYQEWKFVYPEDAASVDAIAGKLTSGNEKRAISHNRNFTKDGRVIHCVWHNSVLRGAEGEILSVLSLVQDVTESVIAAETIRENERLYQTLIAATNTGYVQIDASGIVTEANEEYIRLTGRKARDEIVGHSVTEWTAVHDLERNVAAVHRCLAEGFTRNFEVDYVWPDGTVVAIEVNAAVDRTPRGTRIVAFCRDITARRKTEAERRSFEHKLQETQKLESLGILAGGIAHDFNNLLTGILGNASLVRMDLGEGTHVQPFLEQIEVAATRAAELCRQMLAYSGKGRFVLGSFDLNQIVGETARLLQISVSKKIEVNYDLASDLPAVVGDVTQIRQIVMNLVINAAESIGESGGRIDVTTRVVEADRELLGTMHLAPDLPEGRYVSLEISDTGCGMDPEVQARIFDPFFTTKFTGRGLGLAAVLGIVRAHRGAVRVESRAGHGSTFKVLLPPSDAPVAPVEERVAAAPDWRGSGTVLVVDDEETVRLTLSHMLRTVGFDVVCANDGQEGIEKFAVHRESIVLVMLDLTMPRVDGEEALRAIRELEPTALVLIMSGYDEAEVLSRFRGHQIAGFVQKPFRISAIREQLQRILAM